MASRKMPGTCSHCGRHIDKKVIAEHVLGCEKRAQVKSRYKSNSTDTLIIHIEDKYQPQFWLLLEVKAARPLEQLDSFLRHIWLECCGHLSSFEIDRNRYDIAEWQEMGSRSMDIPIKDVLTPGTQFSYTYDFGSSTELIGRVIDKDTAGSAGSAGKAVTLLARNDPPQYQCSQCDQPATIVCSECMFQDQSPFYCDKCIKTHNCEFYLPVVNSPRMGVCAYGT